MDSKIRLVIADDETLVREYLGVVIREEEDFDVVGLAGNGEEALQLVMEHYPDIALLDISMPTMDGVETSRAIRRVRPLTRIAMLTGSTDRETAFQALEAGADAFLLKSNPRSEIISSLRSLARGEIQIASPALKAVIQEFRRMRGVMGQSRELPLSISDREKQVLRLIVRGHSNKEIARELGVQVSTVKSHLYRAFEKLGVQDRTQAALLATKEGWFMPQGG